MKNNLFKILIIFGIILMTSILFFLFLKPNEQSRLEVSFLDVGQGDSTLIRTPFGQNILIDGGPDDSVVYGLSQELPWWDRTIDLVILTHPHDDHVFGLIDVLERYRVKKVLYTGALHSSPGYIAWLELIRDKKIPLAIIRGQQRINLGDGCYLDILYPNEDFVNKEVEELNNTSIVTKLVYGETSFLFTGDAEAELENKLLELGIDISANVLKVAHHGSDTSSRADFLVAVDSDIAVISVSSDNDFGHPSGRALKRLERSGAKVYRTDKDGLIKFKSNGMRIYK